MAMVLSSLSDIMLQLPSVLKTRIASYLEASDAFALSNTCKTLHHDLGLSILPPYELLFSQVWVGDATTGDVPVRSERIPIFASHPHSIYVSCRWKDQGWGNKKGRLFVVAEDIGEKDVGKEGCDGEWFDGGQLVWESPLVSHEFTHLKIMLIPQKNKEYHFWYRCGKEGGHMLMVEDLVVQTIFFDNNQRSLEKNYRRLRELGILLPHEEDGDFEETGFGGNNEDLEFFTSLLITVAQSLLIQLQSDDPVLESELSDFVTSLHLEVSNLSLAIMQAVCHFFLQYIGHPGRTSHRLLPLSIESTSMRQASSIRDLSSKPLIPLLGPTGMAFLSQTKKEMNTKLHIVPLSPPFLLIPFATWEGDSETGDIPRRVIRIPFFAGRTLSIRLSWKWKDQGFGNEKGKLYIIAKQVNTIYKSSSRSDETCLAGGRLVWESPTISHELEGIETNFAPRDDEVYYLFQKAGGGGQLSLYVENMLLHATVLDDTDGCLVDSYQKLAWLNPHTEEFDSPVPSKLLLSVTQSLRRQVLNDKALNSVLVDFLGSYGFQTDPNSLLSLAELVQRLIEHNDSLKSRMPVLSPHVESDLLFRTYAAM
jgi:hypothetical protein